MILNIKEHFLTISQCKEFQNLGISFKNANFGFYNFYESLSNNEINEIRQIDPIIKDKLITKTLSVSEMIQMLPDYIISYNSESAYLAITKRNVGYYTKKNETIYETMNFLLKDSLFTTLKWLKNKNKVE